MEENESTSEQALETSKPKKHHKKWPWVLLAILALIVSVVILVIGYFGFVPGISNIMGAKTAKDLGVKYTPADFEAYKTKTGVQFLDFSNAPVNPENPTKKIVFAEPKQQTLSLSQAEVTAAINNSGWLWMPLSNTQVKFGNGTVEVSGNLQLTHIKEFISFIGGVNVDNADIDRGVSWATKFANGAPVYIKANASVSNGALSLQVTDAQVGRYSVPLTGAQNALKAGASNAINRTAGLKVDSATFSNGNLNFSGTSPTVIYVKKN